MCSLLLQGDTNVVDTYTTAGRYLVCIVDRTGALYEKDRRPVVVPGTIGVTAPQPELKAVVVHIGSSARAGHYICAVEYLGAWYEINDGIVTCIGATPAQYLDRYKSDVVAVSYDKGNAAPGAGLQLLDEGASDAEMAAGVGIGGSGVSSDGEDGNESEETESDASIGSRAREGQLRLGEDFSDQGDEDDSGLSLSDFDDNGGDGGDDSEDSSMAESVRAWCVERWPGVFSDGEDGNESEDSESDASIVSRAREGQLRLGEDFSDKDDEDDQGLSLSGLDDNGGDGGDDSEDSFLGAPLEGIVSRSTVSHYFAQ